MGKRVHSFFKIIVETTQDKEFEDFGSNKWNLGK